jgi:hypothetical protein
VGSRTGAPELGDLIDAGRSRRAASRRSRYDSRVKAPRWLPLLVVVSASLGVACGGVGAIRYRGPTRPRVDPDRVAVHVVDCREEMGGPGSAPTSMFTQCTYKGQPLPWTIVGTFRVTSKQIAKWDKWREKVPDRAAEMGCSIVAVRREAPAVYGEEADGAYCLAEQETMNLPAAATTAPTSTGRCGTDADCTGGTHCIHDVCR